jgi:hypothetical protein
MWKNMVQTDRQATDDSIRGRMRSAWWVTKTTNIYSEYVIIITLPLQKWLHRRTSMVGYKTTACLVLVIFEYQILDGEIKRINSSSLHILIQILIFFLLQMDRRSSTPRCPLQSGIFWYLKNTFRRFL